MCLNEFCESGLNRVYVHADDFADCLIQRLRLLKVVHQVVQIEPRLLNQHERAQVFEIVFGSRLSKSDFAKCFVLVDNRLQYVVDSVAVGSHIQIVQLVQTNFVFLALDLRFVLSDVDYGWFAWIAFKHVKCVLGGEIDWCCR